MKSDFSVSFDYRTVLSLDPNLRSYMEKPLLCEQLLAFISGSFELDLL